MLIGGADPLGMPPALYSCSRAPEHNVSNTNGFRTSLIYHDAFRNLLKLNDHNNIFKSFPTCYFLYYATNLPPKDIIPPVPIKSSSKFRHNPSCIILTYLFPNSMTAM